MPAKAFRQPERSLHDLTPGSDVWTWVVLNVLKVPTDVAFANTVSSATSPTTINTPPTWKKKMATRIAAGLVMAALLSMVVATGHLAVCIMIVAIQCAIFGELVSLRFNQAKTKAVEGPMFRTVQWGWFATAMVHSYSSSWLKAPLGGQNYLAQLHNLTITASLPSSTSASSSPSPLGGASPEALVEAVAVAMYSVMLVVTVLSLAPGLYQQQIGQLSWTGFVIVAVVFQLKVTVYSIYSGLYFVLFPASLVVANDTFAYFCGMSMGKKIVKRPFMALSPSKTWEGFIGAFVLTLCYAYCTANLWGSSPWMRCSLPELSNHHAAAALLVESTGADADADADAMAAMLPPSCAADGYFVANVDDGSSNMSRAQAVGLGLALFASLIAPFGGFFASAVKRATSVKDFAGYIPGHGGLTDRMDCQLLMAVASWAAFAVCMPLAAAQVGNFKYDISAGTFVNGSS